MATARAKPEEPVQAPAQEDEGYEDLLQRYKDGCAKIYNSCSRNYGRPDTPEQKELKRVRLNQRKLLRANAPLKTCWFCAAFSINNYEAPCRLDLLEEGAVPKDACDKWELAKGPGYLEDGCTRALQELAVEKVKPKRPAISDFKEKVVKNDAPKVLKEIIEVLAVEWRPGSQKALRPWGPTDRIDELRMAARKVPEKDAAQVLGRLYLYRVLSTQGKHSVDDARKVLKEVGN